MTSEQFCYWLQGFFEISQTDVVTSDEVKVIKDHLNLVFNKVTPDRTRAISLGRMPEVTFCMENINNDLMKGVGLNASC